MSPIAVPGTALDDYVRAFAATPFALESEPPFRLRLYRTGARQYVLVLVVHHIAADEWSLTPMLRDTADAYRPRLAGRAPQWDPLPVQYVDYAAGRRTARKTTCRPGSTSSPACPSRRPLPHDRARGRPAATRAPKVFGSR
ncbi:hypothetical protein GS854_25520 [Rhodococcus hoagii]|nr:hypothetical protein [Prescottella equi]